MFLKMMNILRRSFLDWKMNLKVRHYQASQLALLGSKASEML
jgi:hypothetical protein